MIRAASHLSPLRLERTLHRPGEPVAVLAAIGACGLLWFVGLANGGYFSTTWAWIVVVLSWTTCLALLLNDRVGFSGLEAATLASLVLFVGWVAVSIVWSDDRSQSIAEVERDVVYVVGVLASLLVVRRSTVPHLLCGLLAGITAIDAKGLSTRLFPSGSRLDPIALNQLSRPLGYSNGLGILTVLGILLAAGFALRSENLWSRAAAGAVLPVLFTTLYFTYSRGSWLALFAAAAAMVALDPRRQQLLSAGAAVAPASAVAIWLSSREEGLTSLTGSYSDIREEGRHIFAILALLAIASGASALLAAWVERRVAFGAAVRHGYTLLLAAAALVVIAAVFARYGDPVDLTRRAYGSFTTAPSSAPPQRFLRNDLNQRLFTLSGTYRIEQWRAAWHDYESSPWLGTGAGSFERYWQQHRPVRLEVRDAHSLYMEVVAELGWVGFVLIAVALATPVVAAARSRTRPLVPAACGAYVAYVLHAGIDWDWEMPVVTLSALVCGVSLLASARDVPRIGRLVLNPFARGAMAAAVIAIAAMSVLGVIGNRALASATHAVDSANWATAASRAREATRWMPWSGPAWQQLGDAQLGLGDRRSARASLLKAAQKSPRDWSIWFDLGTASHGRERRAAYREAARLNPLASNVRLLRASG